jgi:transcriptional regulator with XRE-family HTH domain
MKQRETAIAIGVSERYYQHIENGTREGKGRIWDALETLLKTPQRQLRENITQPNSNTDKEDVRTGKDPDIAAAEVSKEDGLIVKLLRAVCESKDIPATLTVEVLADGIGAEERGVFKKEIQEAVVALQGAEAALG